MQQDLWRRLKPTFCLVAAAVVVLLAETALGCPTCKDGIAEADPAAQRMAAGYFYSILFMMSAPFVILGTLGSCAYVSIRRARSQQQAAETD